MWLLSNPATAVRRGVQRGLVEALTLTDNEFGCYFQPTRKGSSRGIKFACGAVWS